MSALERLLRPQSIVAIGGLQARRVVEQCRLMGFAGDIWPVHPTKKEVEGLPAYASVAELPGSPDAAFIGVNRHLTIKIVKQLRTRDCGGVYRCQPTPDYRCGEAAQGSELRRRDLLRVGLP